MAGRLPSPKINRHRRVKPATGKPSAAERWAREILESFSAEGHAGSCRRWRRRRALQDSAPIRLQGGRKRNLTFVSDQGRRWRQRKNAAVARSCLLSFIKHFCRTGVIAKTDVHRSTCVRRMCRVATALRAHGATTEAVTMALLFDWAWRSPSRSARLLRFWEHRHDKTGDTKVMWEHVQAETARGCTTDSRTTFWTGRLALHCEAAVGA